jgi:hypothetical protein
MAKLITSKDYDEVIAAAHCYVEAMEQGSSKRAKERFHAEGGIYGYVDGEFKGGSITNFFDFLDENPAGHKMKAHMDVLSITPSTAIVKIEAEMDPPETDYTDFMALVKVNGVWQIVAKIFHSYPR